MDEYERCDYLMTLCEELNKNACSAYDVAGDWVFLFGTGSSERSLRRVFESSCGGRFVLDHYLAEDVNDGFGVFLDALASDMDLSLFTGFLRADEVNGEHVLADEAHEAACWSSSSRIMKWLLRDGLFNTNLLDEDAIVSCGNTMALGLLLKEGHDPNFSDGDGLQCLTYDGKMGCPVMTEAFRAAGALNGRFNPSAKCCAGCCSCVQSRQGPCFPGRSSLRMWTLVYVISFWSWWRC